MTKSQIQNALAVIGAFSIGLAPLFPTTQAHGEDGKHSNRGSSQSQHSPGHEVQTLDLPHKVTALDAFRLAESEGVKIKYAQLDVGNGGGIYAYDPELTATENANAVLREIEAIAHVEPTVTELTVDRELAGSQSLAGGVTGSAADDVLDEFADLPSAVVEDKDISFIREDEDGLGESFHSLADSSKGVEAMTKSHPNRVVYRTEDDVEGKRQLTIDAAWQGGNDIKSSPRGWGFEVQLYQVNRNLSDKVHRPACPKGNDERFWAHGDISGAVVVFSVNEGISDDELKGMELYLDSNHLSDPCSQGAIGFGIGEPANVPDWGDKGGDRQTQQDVFAKFSLAKGKNAWSHIWAASKFVKNGCPGRATTNCMGLGGAWPEEEWGGKSDMLLLNKDRGWKTPAYFSWDYLADRRPLPLDR